MRALITRMWAPDPRERPSAQDIGAALDAMCVKSSFGQTKLKAPKGKSVD